MEVVEPEEVAMSVVLSAVCDRCGAEHRPERPVSSFSPGAVRTRAALHGWGRREERGVVLDVCPACVQATAPVPRAAERVLLQAAPQAPSVPAPAGAGVVHPTLLDDEVVTCHWCEEAEHQWCKGCDCVVCALCAL